jgi:Tfp pilus assembly protein PilF
MSLIRSLIGAITVLWFAGCATQEAPNRYQLSFAQAQPGDSAVAELQRSARSALESGDYEQAVDFLQRAIRIEPRNAHSWHYLAEAYWHHGDFRRCSEMVERSASYSSPGDGLEGPNLLLREKCRQG